MLAHTGGENTVPVVDARLADPRLLRLPLECGVIVIAAHCATKSGLGDPDYFNDWVQLLAEFPNLYGDISAMISLNRSAHLRDCLRPEILPRIVHGSDFPVPVLGHRLWLTGSLGWNEFRRCQKSRIHLSVTGASSKSSDFRRKRGRACPACCVSGHEH